MPRRLIAFAYPPLPTRIASATRLRSPAWPAEYLVRTWQIMNADPIIERRCFWLATSRLALHSDGKDWQREARIYVPLVVCTLEDFYSPAPHLSPTRLRARCHRQKTCDMQVACVESVVGITHFGMQYHPISLVADRS